MARPAEEVFPVSSPLMDSLGDVDALGYEHARRARKAVEDNWEDALVWLAAGAALALTAYLIVRAIIRRRRKTFWQRALGHLEALGKRSEDVVKRVKKLAEDNIDADKIASQVGGRLKNIDIELKDVERAISAARTTGKKLAKKMS